MFVTLHTTSGATHLTRHEDILNVTKKPEETYCAVRIHIEDSCPRYLTIQVTDSLEDLKAKLNFPFPSSLPEQANT